MRNDKMRPKKRKRTPTPTPRYNARNRPMPTGSTVTITGECECGHVFGERFDSSDLVVLSRRGRRIMVMECHECGRLVEAAPMTLQERVERLSNIIKDLHLWDDDPSRS